ncbi:excisionase [Cronobacter turicensis]|uniref:excisionase n=1 Tax=Cronobacter turicensis TaxID=413502 RepID=UPI003570EBD2
MAKLLNLQEWAAEVYTTPPSLSTLRRWTREGRIYPAPELHGKEYKVQPDAIYVDPRKKNLRIKPKNANLPTGGTLLERLTHGEKASSLRR